MWALELLWQEDGKYWGGKSSLLLPILGLLKNDEFYVCTELWYYYIVLLRLYYILVIGLYQKILILRLYLC